MNAKLLLAGQKNRLNLLDLVKGNVCCAVDLLKIFALLDFHKLICPLLRAPDVAVNQMFYLSPNERVFCTDMDSSVPYEAVRNDGEWTPSKTLADFEPFLFNENGMFLTCSFAFSAKGSAALKPIVESRLLNLFMKFSINFPPFIDPLVTFDKMIYEMYASSCVEYFSKVHKCVPNFIVASYKFNRYGLELFLSVFTSSRDNFIALRPIDENEAPKANSLLLARKINIKPTISVIVFVKFSPTLKSTHFYRESSTVDSAYHCTYVLTRRPTFYYTYVYLTNFDIGALNEFYYYRYLFCVNNFLKRGVNLGYVLVRLYDATYVNIYHWFLLATKLIRPYAYQKSYDDNTVTDNYNLSTSLLRVSNFMENEDMIFYYMCENQTKFRTKALGSVQDFFEYIRSIKSDDVSLFRCLSTAFSNLLSNDREVYVSLRLYKKILNLKYLYREHFVFTKGSDDFSRDFFIIL